MTHEEVVREFMGIFGRIRLDLRKSEPGLPLRKLFQPIVTNLSRWSSEYFKCMKPVLMR
jgi:hypothetical protein